MKVIFVVVAALSLGLSAGAMAQTYKLDSAGKCRDDHNKFAKAELCVQHTYKLDAKSKCRDEKGKFVDGKFCHA